jgi:3D (Asp-Asp-Asp) domain-containing protein
MKMNKTKVKKTLMFIVALVAVTTLAVGHKLYYEHNLERIEALELDKRTTYERMLEYETELGENYKHITSLNEELEVEQSENAYLHNELAAMNIMLSTLKNPEYELVYIGDYKLTHYCTEKRAHICGSGAGITSTGTQVTAGRTIAVDPSVIPYGTEVYIEGYGWRVAEDCGGAVNGKHIDIAVETHSQALSMGTTTGGVWILVKKGS